MNGERDVELQRTYRTLNLVWLAMLGALGIYVALVLFLGNQLSMAFQQPSSVLAIARPVFLAVSVLQLLLAFALRRALPRKKGQTYGTSVGATELSHGMQRYQTAVIVSLTLAEAPGLIGLLYFMISCDTRTFFILAVLSAVATWALRPKRDELLQFATRESSVF